MAIIQVASWTSLSVSGLLRVPEISIPFFASTSTASGLGLCPGYVLTPAEDTFRSGRPAIILRKRPSAIGLRQTFPVQTNKTVLCRLKVRETATLTWAAQWPKARMRNADRELPNTEDLGLELLKDFTNITT